MKLLSLLFIALVLGLTVAEPVPSPSPTTGPTISAQAVDEASIDPIYEAYEHKAKELYVKALIDYYHTHPARLEHDLSELTSAEYSLFVPSELLKEFGIDSATLMEKIQKNDRMMDNNEDTDIQADNDEEGNNMETSAQDDTDFETSQFGRFGGFGLGRGFGGFGFRRFGFGFPYYGGLYGGGWGYPYGGFGYGGGFGGNKGGYGGYGGFGYGFPGFGYGGFGFGRRFGFI